MSTWNEKLKEIKNLREQRKKADDELYANGIELQKTKAALKILEQKQPPLTADSDEVKAIRNQIAQLEGQLQEINVEAGKIETFFSEIKANANLIEFLEKKLQAVNSQLESINHELDEERQKQKPDQQKIDSLIIETANLQTLIEQLEEDLAHTKKVRQQLTDRQQQSENKKNELENRRKRIKAESAQRQTVLVNRTTPATTDPEETRNKKNQLEASVIRNRGRLEELRNELHNSINQIYPELHPREAVVQLPDDIPFLLFPVRIETRFVNQDNANELWVRIYPDEIAIHTHEKILTNKEVEEGIKYWKALFDAEKNGGTAKEDMKKTAWLAIAELFSPSRAAWIARQTKPTNWSNDLSGIADESILNFSQHDLTKTDAWSRAPRTDMLPDKFVLMLYQGDDIVIQRVGHTIPDELFLGPDPMDVDNAFVTEQDKLGFGPSFDWTSKFDKAVAQGMGFKILLNSDQATRGFTKLLVMGLNLSLGETESKQLIEEMIDNHHYSPKGFSIVKQGTPTNNTDDNDSGYTGNDSFQNTSYFVETGKELFNETDDCDGRNLADALGIDYTVLQYILNSDGTDHKEAVAMNHALYPSTLDYYFEAMMDPVLGESKKDELRAFFTKNVTGRGLLPAIRVGNQPYGILVTSNFSNWHWQRKEPTFSNSFLNGLLSILKNYHEHWNSLLSKLKHVGKPGDNPDTILMDILGLQPGSVSFYQRTAYSTEDLWNRDGFEHGDRYYKDMQKSFTSKGILLDFLEQLGYNVRNANGSIPVPQLLRLVFHHRHSRLDSSNLIDNLPLSESDLIHYYNTGAKKNYLHWLAESDSVKDLEQQDFGTGILPPSSLLFLQLRRSLLLQLHKSSVSWFDKHKIKLDQTLKPANFYNIRPEPSLTKWEVMKAKVGVADPNADNGDKSVADHLLTGGKNLEEAAFLTSMRKAIEFLAGKATAKLERSFTEHLDCCTYRLDAWQSALFQLRLKKQRQLPEGNNTVNGQEPGRVTRKKGVFIGSYGWLEDVMPSSKRKVIGDELPEKLRPEAGESVFEYDDNGGFVHAPSINQATAAAVLRAGYLSHSNAADPDLMSVNLSSERVRRALFILQGIRNGQMLEALLGYQFERGLHDRASANTALAKLNLYIYDFRDKYPIEIHHVQQSGNNTPNETIPANNVVNGLLLSGNKSAYPYGATGDVLSATPDERIAIEHEKDKLDDTLDAVKDLLLSESTYQMVMGNFNRAGALLNALKEAQIPPDIEVINTPRSSHFTFTNRVTIQFENADPGDAADNPWFPVLMTPRAVLEPGMNKWCGNILGDATTIQFRVAHLDKDGAELGFKIITLDKLELQPIDLVYLAGNELNTGSPKESKESKTATSELESRIASFYRRNEPLDNEVPIQIEFLKPEGPGIRTLGEMLPLLRMLKTLVSDSRPVNAQDFESPSKKSMADKNNPKGFEVGSLLTRIQNARTIFESYLGEIRSIAIDATVQDSDGVITLCVNLGEAFDALDLAKLSFSDSIYGFTNTSASQLQLVMMKTSLYGIADSFPQRATVISNEDKLTVLEQARNLSRGMNTANTSASDLIAAAIFPEAEKNVQKLIEAGKTLFGEAFNILPHFSYNNEPDILQSKADTLQLMKHATNDLKMIFPADEWMQSVSHVRPRLARLEYIRSIYELNNSDALEIIPVQLPYRTNDSWIAIEFPGNDGNDPSVPFSIDHDTLSVTIHGPSAFAAAIKQSGLLVDDWTELVPAAEEITGITFNYNQPNAAAPQALLLAVTPEEKGHWTWDDLVSIVNDTLLRAKLRAVEPQLLDSLENPQLSVLLPALLANFSKFDLDFALDYKLNVKSFAEQSPILSALSSLNQ